MATSEVLTVSKANNAFTNRLYKELAKKDGNVFFSPISIHTILALAGQGAAGKTAEDFVKTLGVDLKTAADGYNGIMDTLNNVPNVTLNMANKVYVMDKYALHDDFQAVSTKKFLTEAEHVNFADSENAANKINGWCAAKTNNKITKLIEPDDLNALTRMVLLNAIYFKGDWLQKFNPKYTEKKPFYVNEKETVQVDMMFISKKFNFGYIQELDAQVLEMKYKNEDVSMVIVLPNKKDGIKELEEKLSNYDLSTLTSKLYQTTVDVHLPKFKIETKMDLKETLEAVGLGRIFSDEADFSKLLKSPEGLKVSKAIQKAYIEVNEEGAEAAAVTGMMMMTRCAMIPEEPKKFIADHPFLFYIKNRTEGENIDSHHTLFLGKIGQPNP